MVLSPPPGKAGNDFFLLVIGALSGSHPGRQPEILVEASSRVRAER
jgi:hypothetical protein